MIRSASSGTAISGVLPTCGVMMQFGSDHSGWPVGQRLGVGDVETGAADHALAQRRDEVVGDDVPATGDVDEPGVALHQLELAGGDDALGLRGEGEGQDDEVGARQGVGVAVGLEHVVDARRCRSTRRRTTVMWQSNGWSSRTSDSVIPPPPRIVTRPPSRLVPCGGCHESAPGRTSPRPRRPASAERQRELGHRLGVHALAARPLAVVVDEVDEVLDAGERQLHPPGVRCARGAARRARPGRGGRAHTMASASASGTT